MVLLIVNFCSRNNKSVFIFLRQLTTCHCPHLLPCAVLLRAQRRAAIDRYLLLAGHTAANLQQRSAAGEWRHKQTDGQTDGRTERHRTVTYTLLRILRGGWPMP